MRGLSSCREESISGLLIKSLIRLLCSESDPSSNVSDVTKRGETPFMELQVKEKSTGNDSLSPNEENSFLKVFLIYSNIIESSLLVSCAVFLLSFQQEGDKRTPEEANGREMFRTEDAPDK